jgi:hypothetical protein
MPTPVHFDFSINQPKCQNGDGRKKSCRPKNELAETYSLALSGRILSQDVYENDKKQSGKRTHAGTDTVSLRVIQSLQAFRITSWGEKAFFFLHNNSFFSKIFPRCGFFSQNAFISLQLVVARFSAIFTLKRHP